MLSRYTRSIRRWLRNAGRFARLFCLIALLSACVTDPFTGRRTIQLIPDAQMNALGTDAYQQILAESQVSANPAQTALVRRDDESQADRLGLLFMAKAGYDPNEAVAFWERMDALGGSSVPELLSTHPSHPRRIADIRTWLPDAIREYEAAQ